VAAKKDGVPVTAQAKKDATVLLELKKGETIEAQDREGMFWKVQLKDGRTGYVSVINVQRQAGEASGLQGALREAALEAREAGGGENARARSAVMGIRGLDESKDTGAMGTIRPDLRAVYRMEDRIIADQRIENIESLVAQEVENAVNGQVKREP
jgi:hypothetical protein